ncbi:MAG TPA: hypothetical protein VKB94_01235 [Rhizomicrobium sp.]|nr:hypothetical protein [Rhizomicrobium sp.]
MRYAIPILAVFLALSVLPAPAQPRAMAARPDGTGDPDATTCRPPQPIANSRLSGPPVCKLNSQWALLRKNGQDMSADGREIIPDPKGSNIAPMNCSVTGGGATNGGGQMNCRIQ